MWINIILGCGVECVKIYRAISLIIASSAIRNLGLYLSRLYLLINVMSHLKYYQTIKLILLQKTVDTAPVYKNIGKIIIIRIKIKTFIQTKSSPITYIK